MELAEGPNARVVDVVEDNVGSDYEVQACIHAVEECDNVPRGVVAPAGGSELGRRGLAGPLNARNGAIGLLCGEILDDEGNEEVAGDQQVQQQAVLDVLAAVVVARDADDDAVLGRLASWPLGMQLHRAHLAVIFNDQPEVLEDCGGLAWAWPCYGGA